ncbi:MAG: alanine dehydrogenase [Proteobacteria bacterium]|nr:alanine dehydrogenase [Pseudomonadota bacterium]
MLVGVPKEIKNHEYRVGLIPAAVRELVHHGHEVLMETNAGAGIGYRDEDYAEAGAQIAPDAKAVFDRVELIVKVKEPQAIERTMLHEDQTLFTFLHLAPDLDQTQDLVGSGSTCIAYETVTDAMGRLPLLAPMSEVAGRMSIQAGAMCMEKSQGGSGILLGGVPGVMQGHVVILGGGVVGQNAAQMAVGMGAKVTVVDRNVDVLKVIDRQYGNRVQTLYSTQDAVFSSVMNADLVIGSVLIPGASAPKLVTADMVREMKTGTVVVDVAIDQGGCFETSHATTHDDPTYILDGVVHYCVANMPGAVARTSAAALNNATLPFVLELADKGVRDALNSNVHLLHGLNVYRGQVTNEFVGKAHNMDYIDPVGLLAA